MRSNSIGLRLNYSSSWQNKIAPGRGYVDSFIKAKFILNNYFESVFHSSFFSNLFINNKYQIYFIGNVGIIINVYVYLFRHSDVIKKAMPKNTRFVTNNSLTASKKTSSLLHRYTNHVYLRSVMTRAKGILLLDLYKILPDRYILMNFVAVKKKYFDASLASLYVTNKLLNKFKLNKVVEDLSEDLIMNKSKSGIIVHCAGRFDRKERASSSTFGKGKISLTTLQNKITYRHSEATLKYGVCGVKVWVLE